MTIAAVEEDSLPDLERIGVKDSKLLTREQREAMVARIEELCEVETIEVSPKEIDDAVLDPARNLNILESEVAAELVAKLVGRLGAYKVKEVMLDCPSSNIQAYLEDMRARVKRDVDLKAEHKADLNYPVVAAASIIAKVARDKRVEELHEQAGVDFGSGYPGDPRTARFVRERYADFDFFRKTWQTYKRAAAKGSQESLGRFGADTSLPPGVVEKRDKILALESEGFERVEAKGAAEVVRMRRPGCTVTLYHNGKVLVQGKDAAVWKGRF